MIEYEVWFRDEKIGILLTDGPRRDWFIPEESGRRDYFIPGWTGDNGWTYIPLFENMIRDTLRIKPEATHIARFTNDFVLVRKNSREQTRNDP